MLTKQRLRNRILARLKIQKEENRSRKSRLIRNKLFRTRVFQKAKRVMFYITFDGEVETQEMIKQAKKLGKRVAVPVCKKDRTMRPCLLGDSPRLVKGLYGIMEPAIKNLIDLKKLDLIIVPGIAFTKDGRRLGRGKGYYDRFLKKIPDKAAAIGLAYDFQILPDIPTIVTDATVDRIISA
jgi:5-formyltetrahydrofolate cyclo-ligase